MTKTYWFQSPRGFANEYHVGVATTKEHGEQYKAEGFFRIRRDRALRELSDSGDAATDIYAGVTIDGKDGYDRFQVARAIRTGDSFERY